MRRVLLLTPVALFLAVFFAWPLALVARAALDGGSAWAWLAGPYALSRVGLAFGQAFLSVLLVLAVAVPLAVLHHRRSVPGARVLLALQAAPFVMPVFVVVFGLQAILARDGWLDAWTGVDVFGVLGPLGAVVVANAYYNTGMATRLLHAALARRPRQLEEAAATLGASGRAAFVRASLPLIGPSLAAVALLVFLFSFGSFGVVLLLGQGDVDTLDTLLYANLGGAFPREDRGAVLALTQVAIQAAILGAYFALERRARRLPGAPETASPRARTATTVLAWTVGLLTLAPAAAVLVGGFQVRGEWSLAPWRTLLDASAPGHLYALDVGQALAWSLAYAAGAVALAIALVLLLAYGARGLRLRRLVEGAAALPLGTSSVVLGFGFLLAFTGRTPLPLVGNPIGVLAAHALLAFPFAARILLPALRGLDARLDEAAALLGASPASRVLRVQLAQVRPALAAACAFAAALSLGDYGASLLLMTDDIMGLSVWVGTLRSAAPFDPLVRAQAVALAGLLLVVTLGAFLAFEALGGRRRRTA